MKIKENSQGGLKTRQKAMYGMGEISNTLMFTVVPLFLMFYLTDVLGIPAVLAGVVSFAGNIFDAITDPLAGNISDRCRSKLGRRRPFFLITAIPNALAFIFLFSVPTGLDMTTKMILVSLLYMLLFTTTSFYIVPYLTYGMELDPTYHGRTAVAAWRMLFSIGFGLVAAVVPDLIWQSEEVASEGFSKMAWMLAIPIVLSQVIAFFANKEKPLGKDEKREKSNFMRNAAVALKNVHFRRGLAVYVLTWLGIGVLQIMLIYYVRYVLQMEAEYALIAGLIFGVAVFSLPLWVKISKKMHKRSAYTIGSISFCVFLAVLLCPPEFVRSIIWIIVPLLGVGLSSLHVMPAAIIPEAVDEAVKSDPKLGNGNCYGVISFITKIGTAAIDAIVMAVLGFSGYISTTEAVAVTQPESAILAIRLIIVLVPLVLFVSGIFVCRRFKITGAEAN